MDENWDDEITSAKPFIPTSSLSETTPEINSFSMSFGKKDSSDTNEESTSSIFAQSFSNRQRSENDNQESTEHSFSRSFAGRGKKDNQDQDNNGNSFGRGRRFDFNKNDNNNRRSGGFAGNRDGDNGERKNYGDSFRKSYNNRDRDNNENSDRRYDNRSDKQNDERKSFNNRDRSEGGFQRGNRDSESRGGYGRNRNSNENEEKSFSSFNNRNRNDNGDGERKTSFIRDYDRNDNGDKKTYSSFRNRSDKDDGERKPYGGFGNSDRDNGNENGERKGFRNFNRNKDENENNGFSFKNRNRDENENNGFAFKSRNRDENQNGERSSFRYRNKSEEGDERKSLRRGNGENREKKNFENGENEIKRERYIPEEIQDNEENLFTTITAGINFQKTIEIPCSLTGDGQEKIEPIKNFEDAKFSELLLTNIKKTKYEIPTPVQKYAIPTILAKRDLMACAQTGSGKTAAFVLPIMANILKDGIQSSELMAVQEPQALILSPTRELAIQIFHECKKFGYESMIKTAILYGGVETGYQLSNLRKGCNILVATPGRLLDVLEKGKISLEKVKYFVLDEADRMLDLGFEKAVRDILEKGKIQTKGERNTFMFSATFPDNIQKLAQDFLNDYLFLTVGIVGGANTDVEQKVYKVTKFEKREKLIEILNEIGNDKTMIFVEHKMFADVIGFFLIQKGYPSTTIHGDRLQSQREAALNDFKSGKSNIIVCTSVAARGLDIENVKHVINLDLPQSIDEYVHRIGRTGRCGNLGKAISFFDPECANDAKLARQLVRTLTQAQQTVPEWLNSIAEESVGTLFNGTACTNDMRSKFGKMTISSNETAADDAPKTSATEECWD